MKILFLVLISIIVSGCATTSPKISGCILSPFDYYERVIMDTLYIKNVQQDTLNKEYNSDQASKNF